MPFTPQARSDLDCLYRPRSVAVIGASDREDSIAGALTRNLVDGFMGTVTLVNPARSNVLGRPCLPSIEALGETFAEPPDLAVIVTPADAVLASVEALAPIGVKAAVVITDPKRGRMAAAELRQRLLDVARSTGLRINGPNCLGIATPALGLHATMSRFRAADGDIAFFGQSATAAGPMVDWAHQEGLGFSHIISLGDMADVDYADVLFYLADDPHTRVIVLYTERLPSARAFLSAARHAARSKPVIVLKAGVLADGGGQDDIPQDCVYEAVFRRAGILRVRTLETLFNAVEALSMRLPGDAPTARGERLAILANGESMGTLALDTLRERGGMPASLSSETIARLGAILPPGRPRTNPIDILPDADGERYAEALEILMEDTGIDGVLVLAGPTGIASGMDMAQAVAGVVEAARAKPGRRRPWIGTSWPGGTQARPARALFAEAHIPTFETPSAAVNVFHVLNEHRRVREALQETPASIPEAFAVDPSMARSVLDAARDKGERLLGPMDRVTVLSAFGLHREPPRGQAFPATAGAPNPVPWRIASLFDEEFGPLIALGLGGPVAPLIDRPVVALPPLNQTLARDAVLSHAAGARLHRTPDGNLQNREDLDALVFALMQVSQMLVDLEDLAGVVLDPVHVWPGPAFLTGSPFATGPGRGGARWGRAQIRVRAVGEAYRSGARALAIQPYPRELEQAITLRNGMTGQLRPIRPEDEPALGAFQLHLSDEDIRLRFFRMIRKNDHALLATLTQIDYAWHMAFVVTGEGLPGTADIFGVARLIRDHKDNTGEYAVIVRSDMKGRGLGGLLMDRLISYARRIGLSSLYGLVLSDNEGMLRVNRKLGFTLQREPDDPGIIRVTLDLT
ncbi:MAG: GNAT family N-acetyltransferase [Alphaproteobacteria bacterium]